MNKSATTLHQTIVPYLPFHTLPHPQSIHIHVPARVQVSAQIQNQNSYSAHSKHRLSLSLTAHKSQTTRPQAPHLAPPPTSPNPSPIRKSTSMASSPRISRSQSSQVDTCPGFCWSVLICIFAVVKSRSEGGRRQKEWSVDPCGRGGWRCIAATEEGEGSGLTTTGCWRAAL